MLCPKCTEDTLPGSADLANQAFLYHCSNCFTDWQIDMRNASVLIDPYLDTIVDTHCEVRPGSTLTYDVYKDDTSVIIATMHRQIGFLAAIDKVRDMILAQHKEHLSGTSTNDFMSIRISPDVDSEYDLKFHNIQISIYFDQYEKNLTTLCGHKSTIYSDLTSCSRLKGHTGPHKYDKIESSKGL